MLLLWRTKYKGSYIKLSRTVRKMILVSKAMWGPCNCATGNLPTHCWHLVDQSPRVWVISGSPHSYWVQASLLRVLETTPPCLFIYDTVAMLLDLISIVWLKSSCSRCSRVRWPALWSERLCGVGILALFRRHCRTPWPTLAFGSGRPTPPYSHS